MNRAEHLLVCLAEECDEVGQRVAKALRFGLQEVQPGQEFTNAERICVELFDLIAVAEILQREGVIAAFQPSDAIILRKLSRIEKFMAISVEQGTLPAEEPSNG